MQVENQLEQFTLLLASQGLIDPSKTGDATAQAQLMLSQMNFAPPKAKRTAKIVTQEDRCIARVWGDGSGKDQCKSAKCEGSKFCKRSDLDRLFIAANTLHASEYMHAHT